jgi:hypothetical protein
LSSFRLGSIARGDPDNYRRDDRAGREEDADWSAEKTWSDEGISLHKGSH